MEVASLFRTPQPHHLAELRIEGADRSPVAFSDPCGVGRKRRCLFPAAFSPRKRMLLELPPFTSASGSAVGVLPSGAPAATGGSLSFSAVPERMVAPTATGSSGIGGGGGFAFLASPRQPLTPMGSTASNGGGSGFLVHELSLYPTPRGSNGGGVFAFLASPSSAGRSPNDGGGFTRFLSPGPERTASDTTRSGVPFLAPPKPALGPAGSPPSPAAKEPAPAGSGDGGLVVPPFAIPGLQKSAQKPPSGSLWSRRLAHAAAEGHTTHHPRDEQLQITLPPKKATKTEPPAVIADPSLGGATPPASTDTPCCRFLTPPAKASDQEREVAGERASKPADAACTGGELVVSVTCSCGAREEFCFDHRH
ncbi:nascent polypeptide-associated complex subunit alpha, muscle-specific form-like [Oryza brachyantha]|uniref:nascent polypeptide-associated complex subunit alpha, muscle-specific form-like n=1 Tax=Oryza brachyantha TaxID=4533 RepID=UPI001ADD47B3|nr:nascent polypeptide-associated complex subunit alpha, muscle-specific form-like [Oryza brachyantha]